MSVRDLKVVECKPTYYAPDQASLREAATKAIDELMESPTEAFIVVAVSNAGIVRSLTIGNHMETARAIGVLEVAKAERVHNLFTSED